MAKAKKSARKPAKTSAKKPARKAAPKAPQSIKSVLTKSALVAHLADAAKVAAKDVRALLAALEETIHASISKKGPRTFVLPGLLKITVDQRAREEGAQGHQSLYRRADDLQGQARDREGQGAPDEETEGRRERLTTRRLRARAAVISRPGSDRPVVDPLWLHPQPVHDGCISTLDRSQRDPIIPRVAATRN